MDVLLAAQRFVALFTYVHDTMYLDVHKYFPVFGRLNVITSIQSEAKKLNLYNKELNSRREK